MSAKTKYDVMAIAESATKAHREEQEREREAKRKAREAKMNNENKQKQLYVLDLSIASRLDEETFHNLLLKFS
jgi:hypothetical protein